MGDAHLALQETGVQLLFDFTGPGFLCGSRPFSCWSMAFLCRCCTAWQLRKSVQTGDTDYYRAQYMWPKEMKYHMDQFLYKQLHEANKEENPEFLDPKKNHASKKDALQAQYGAAVSAAAENVGKRRGRNKRRAGRAFVGGGVVDLGDGPTSRFTEYSPKEDGSATEPAVHLCKRPGC